MAHNIMTVTAGQFAELSHVQAVSAARCWNAHIAPALDRICETTGYVAEDPSSALRTGAEALVEYRARMADLDPSDMGRVARELAERMLVCLDTAHWTASPDQLVTLETMPDCLRESHRAARNWGVYPANGAVRRSVTRAEAEEIVSADPDEYDHIVE